MTYFKSDSRKAMVMLWLTAAIWGFAFVAQRAGMQYIGPFTYNGIRFTLGSISLLPLLWLEHKRGSLTGVNRLELFKKGMFIGIILFLGASLQQAGMIWTTAGKAGFITGLYVILVPIIGIFIGQAISRRLWFGAVLAFGGLFLLTYNGTLLIEKGDGLVLLSALFWALHVQVINKLVQEIPALLLAFVQFLVCGSLSLIVSLFFEKILPGSIQNAAIPLLYGGLMSVGIAYTLQVLAQKHVHPAHASIVLSFETVFAAIGGGIILHESLTLQNIAGCLLMLTGILLVQFRRKVGNT